MGQVGDPPSGEIHILAQGRKQRRLADGAGAGRCNSDRVTVIANRMGGRLGNQSSEFGALQDHDAAILAMAQDMNLATDNVVKGANIIAAAE